MPFGSQILPFDTGSLAGDFDRRTSSARHQHNQCLDPLLTGNLTQQCPIAVKGSDNEDLPGNNCIRGNNLAASTVETWRCSPVVWVRFEAG